jgi:hypothetical protein
LSIQFFSFPGDSAPAAKPIRHNAGTFSLFKQLDLDAPMSTEEVPALIEKLEGMLEDYKVRCVGDLCVALVMGHRWTPLVGRERWVRKE